MIPKSRRYPLRQSRSIIFSQGKRVRGRFMDIFSISSDTPRGAVMVGKNVSLMASERNTVRRRIQSYLAEVLPQTRLDVVVRALPASTHATYDQLKTEIRRLLARS